MTELEKALNVMDGEGPLPTPSVLPAPFALANPQTQAEIDAVAQQIRDSGIPDVLNRWVGMTPEKLAENKRALARIGKHAKGAKKPKPEKGAVSTGLPKGGLDEAGKKILAEQRAAAEKKKTERLAALKASKASKPVGAKEAALRASREDQESAPGPLEQGVNAMLAGMGLGDKPTPKAEKAVTPEMTVKSSAKKSPAKPATKPQESAKPAAKAAAAGGDKVASAPAKPAEKPAPGMGHKGAFNPAIVQVLIPMIQKGTTIGEVIKAAKWASCADPVMRVKRFVAVVANDDMKLKVKIDGKGEEATLKTA